MRAEKFALGVVIISFLASVYFYSHVPSEIITHWNALGQPDGSMPKLIGLFFMPVLSLLLFLTFHFLPRIDPLKDNIEKFRHYYNEFVLVMLLFLLYMQSLVVLQNAGVFFDMIQFMLPAFGLVFYYTGSLLEHSKKNWFVGIRTPWTMSDDIVWGKTNKLCGRLYKFLSLFTLVGLFSQQYAIYAVFIPVIVASITAAVYSYLEYIKLKNKKKK